MECHSVFVVHKMNEFYIGTRMLMYVLFMFVPPPPPPPPHPQKSQGSKTHVRCAMTCGSLV